jgi:hypothetical protein
MTMNILAAADSLSNSDLLARVNLFAGRERIATADLIAHLAALASRPSLYAAQGYGCLFTYCTRALGLSEDAACNRIEAAKLGRRFPVLLDLLASGSLTLSSLRVLGPHLTPENQQSVLGRAKGLTKRQLQELVVEIAPRPDVPSSMRKLPAPAASPGVPVPSIADAEPRLSDPAPHVEPASIAPPVPAATPTSRSVVEATAPARYRVQFTIGDETHRRLRRVQALMRREVPNGDPAVLFDRALALLEAQAMKTKLAAVVRPQGQSSAGVEGDIRTPETASRHIPRPVKRAVWARDGGVCAFVSADGRRCTEDSFLEFHHVHAYAKHGPATVENISLRCRRHNQYESELVFGPRHGVWQGEERTASGL